VRELAVTHPHAHREGYMALPSSTHRRTACRAPRGHEHTPRVGISGKAIEIKKTGQDPSHPIVGSAGLV